jgi:hypothetical protein
MGKVIVQTDSVKGVLTTTRIKNAKGRQEIVADAYIKGSPAKYAKTLIAKNGAKEALRMVESLVTANTDQFWIQVRSIAKKELAKQQK